MVFQRSEHYKFDDLKSTKEALVGAQDVLTGQGFENTHDLSFRKKAWNLSYNSFSPMVTFRCSAVNITVKYTLAPSTRMVFGAINYCLAFFCILLFALSFSGSCEWFYCAIPLGIQIYSFVISKILFHLSVKRVSSELYSVLGDGGRTETAF